MTTRSTELLRVAHARPGVTRADAARLLGFGTGAATEIVSRLTEAELLAEVPAARSGGRGRPTTMLVAHPEGPLVLAAEITQEAWRVQVVELGGNILATAGGEHDGAAWAEVAASLTGAIGSFQDAYAGRPRALGLSAPGTVSPVPRLDAGSPGAHPEAGLRLDAANLGWRDVDLRTLWPGLFVAGNDATLAASAESRRGAATGAAVALHLRIEAGLGGAVVDHGRVLIGATGAAGEFGHMPFGDPAVACPCGAHGCWGTAVDGSALGRLLGRPTPRDQVTFARRVITAPAAEERPAVVTVARALGRGIAGLVNAVDADLVTLGGLGVDLLGAAPDELRDAYLAGLMAYRRDNPPPIVPSALGDDGPIAGAAEEAWSALLLTLG